MPDPPVPGGPPPAKRDLATLANILGALAFCTMGVSAVAGAVVGVLAVVRSVRQPHRQKRGRAIGALAANVLIVTVVAIAVPSLLRSKLSALQAATIGDLQTMVAAQATYAGRNGGLYEPRHECLAEPARCLVGFPEDGTPFLEPALASLRDKAGYRRAFHPGPPGSRPPGEPARPGVTAFAYTAVPYAYDGMNAFCADSAGVLCYRKDGREPGRTPAGLCDLATCTPWRR